MQQQIFRWPFRDTNFRRSFRPRIILSEEIKIAMFAKFESRYSLGMQIDIREELWPGLP
jgi:hypothetical protein